MCLPLPDIRRQPLTLVLCGCVIFRAIDLDGRPGGRRNALSQDSLQVSPSPAPPKQEVTTDGGGGREHSVPTENLWRFHHFRQLVCPTISPYAVSTLGSSSEAGIKCVLKTGFHILPASSLMRPPPWGEIACSDGKGAAELSHPDGTSFILSAQKLMLIQSNVQPTKGPARATCRDKMRTHSGNEWQRHTRCDRSTYRPVTAGICLT